MQQTTEIVIELSEPQTAVLACRKSLILEMAGQGCFVAGTLIQTETGHKAIEAIKPGEKVLSVNITTGAAELKPVVNVFNYMAGQLKQKLITFVFSDHTIKCTANHEYYSNNKWVSAAAIAGRIMESRSGHRKELFDQQQRPVINEAVAGRKVARDNETGKGCERLFADNDSAARATKDGKNAPYSCDGMEAKPVKLARGKPFRRNKSKQRSNQPRMVHQLGQHETRGKNGFSYLQGKRSGRKKQDGKINRGPSEANKSGIHTAQSIGGKTCQYLQRFEGHNRRNFEGGNLGACEINEAEILSVVIESEDLEVFDLEVLDNNNYCVTEKNILVHNSGKSQNIGYSTGMMISDFPEALGFIGANTAMQLSQSTLVRVFKVWKEVNNFTEWDAKKNPGGAYVVDKRPPLHFTRYHHLRHYEGTISFYNGALVYIGSLENYKAHDGKEFAWAHLDETKDTKENALKEVIIGRLRQYGLWYDKATQDVHFDEGTTPDQAIAKGWQAWNPLYIHTSPALGGVKWLNEMFSLGKFEKEIKREVLKEERGFYYNEFENKAVIIYSTHHNLHNLPPNYIENQKSNLATEDAILKLVYGYPFGKSGGEFYPAFRRDHHVGSVPYIPGLSVHQTWDFNVVPYVTCLLFQILYVTKYVGPLGIKYPAPGVGLEPLEVMQIRFFKEYCFGKFGQPGTAAKNSTEAACAQFSIDFDPAIVEVYYYGDASGASRIPGMGARTNFKDIESYIIQFVHNQSKRVRVPNVGPLTRRDLLNRIFAGKIPTVEIIFDQDMEFTIGDFEHVKEGPDGKIKSKVKDPETGGQYEALGHCTDAAEYGICEVAREYMTNPGG